MRPSTQLRAVRLHQLIHALSARDLGNLDAATLLNCSASGARNYLLELLDAGVVTATSYSGAGPGAEKIVYCLNADQAIVHRFLDLLCKRSACSTGAGPTTARDPLVMALFGAANDAGARRRY